MHIALVIKRFQPERIFGGAEAFGWRLARELAVRGHRIRVYCALGGGWPGRREEIVLRPGTILVERIPYPSVRVLGTVIFNLLLAARLWRHRNLYQVILVFFASTEAITCALLGRTLGKGVVCRPTCSGPEGDLASQEKRPLGRMLARALRLCHRFVVLNEEIVQELAKRGIGAERTVPIANGVDASFFRPPHAEERERSRRELLIDPEVRVIVSVGRLTQQKDYPTLIAALSHLNREGIRWRAFLLGKGREEKNLIAMAREMGLEDRISIGEARQVRPYLWAADVFVLCSRWEGMPNALLEAMACGLPCLCTDTPGPRAVMESGAEGILFPTGSAEALAEALGKLLSAPGERARLGRRARLKVERSYALERVVHDYEVLLAELICPGESDAPGRERLREEETTEEAKSAS